MKLAQEWVVMWNFKSKLLTHGVMANFMLICLGYGDCLSNTSLDVSVKVFYGCD